MANHCFCSEGLPLFLFFVCACLTLDECVKDQQMTVKDMLLQVYCSLHLQVPPLFTTTVNPALTANNEDDRNIPFSSLTLCVLCG